MLAFRAEKFAVFISLLECYHKTIPQVLAVHTCNTFRFHTWIHGPVYEYARWKESVTVGRRSRAPLQMISNLRKFCSDSKRSTDAVAVDCRIAWMPTLRPQKHIAISMSRVSINRLRYATTKLTSIKCSTHDANTSDCDRLPKPNIDVDEIVALWPMESMQMLKVTYTLDTITPAPNSYPFCMKYSVARFIRRSFSSSSNATIVADIKAVK